jgi:3-oxoacyl-(acyl-carrier-protein) synthase
MISQEKIYLLGSGWLSSHGYGFFGSKPLFSSSDGPFQYPKLQDYIRELPGRYGRFDIYTQVCFSAAVLALKDADLLQREGKKNIGIIVGSSSGVYDDDLAFFESTREAGGEFASPNLFSYTLSNVALGEIAVFFNFIGPTFCVGNDPDHPGLSVIPAALSLLASKQWDCILVGWVEASQHAQSDKLFARGAAFAVLSSVKTGKLKSEISLSPSFQFSDLFEG